MRASLSALAITLCSLATLTAGPKEAAEAEASLRLHLALQQAVRGDGTLAARPADGVVVKRPDYATAYYDCLRSGKPLVIHVGKFDCKDACKECLQAGACLTCEAAEIFGDETPRLILAKPSGGKLIKCNEWKTVPTAATIKAAIGGSQTATPFVQRAVDGNGQLPVGSTDALDEVNAVRAARGLKPFVRDDGLTLAAAKVAIHRAANRIFGHANDFAFLPSGVSADAAGCAAWNNGDGWGACCTYESWTYAGAAYVVGADGKRYMHLFVRR